MKKLSIIILIISFIFVSGCNSKKESKNVTYSEAKSTTVYITRTGECYHTSSCSCLSKSKIKKKLSDIYENYRPCNLCYPPVIED